MGSAQRLAPISALILASTALALSACVSGPPTVAAPSACSTLVPSSYRQPVPGADLPGLDAAAGDLWIFGDRQTGQLDKANGRTADTLEIIEGCEARDKATVARLVRPWWKLW